MNGLNVTPNIKMYSSCILHLAIELKRVVNMAQKTNITCHLPTSENLYSSSCLKRDKTFSGTHSTQDTYCFNCYPQAGVTGHLNHGQITEKQFLCKWHNSIEFLNFVVLVQ
uniref:Uncharacterized protein n=1 Tax=Argulus foliaceus TaxID=509924 RepID=A0A7R9SD27_9CRUS